MNSRPRNSILAACLAPVLSILLAGCFFEQPMLSFDVYFDNTTDEDLVVGYKDDPELKELDRLPAHTHSTIQLVREGECSVLFVIRDLDGNTVKTPEKICGQDTITIP